jgi:hypothetical protein
MNRSIFALAFALALPVVSTGLTFATTASADEAKVERVAPSTFEGQFKQYLVGPRGQTMGILLSDGGVVMMPARAFNPGAPALKAGDTLQIEGRVRLLQTGRMIGRALVQRGGVVVADARVFKHHERGERGERGEGRVEHANRLPLGSVTGQGSIVAILASPRGKVHGFVLDDGTTAVMHRHGDELAALGLKVGDKVTVQGRGGTYDNGKGMHLVSITLPSGETRVLAQPKQSSGSPV